MLRSAFPYSSEPYDKDEIIWPSHFRNPGESASDICKEICIEMFNAFGFKHVINQW